VTVPDDAATDPELCHSLVLARMDVARINCAHGGTEEWGAMIQNIRASAEAAGRSCRVLMDLAGQKLRIGALATGGGHIRVRTGDVLLLEQEGLEAPPSPEVRPFDWRASCAVPEIFDEVRVGAPVWFDDGKIGGVVDWKEPGRLWVRVNHARAKVSKLRPNKGINAPGSQLTLPALTEKDLQDLEFVARNADVIALSFVQRPEDVERLQQELERLGAGELGVVLKIETRAGFENLPRLLMAAMHSPLYGVMIARGDLAAELGFERLGEVQEEILWVAEAAHAPTIWATQVLETLAKTGMPSRPEITDAAMSGRAEAVLLNKGPYIVDAIRALDGILSRMQDHQVKKRSLLRPLQISGNL
jgi:pyruvate kinase